VPRKAAVAALDDHVVAGQDVQFGDELDALGTLDERVLLVERREVAHASGVAAVGAVHVFEEDHRQTALAEGVDQAVDVGHDVDGVLHEGGTLEVEVLALQVDRQQGGASVGKVVDHGLVRLWAS